MRDPRTHAKILELRMCAVRNAWLDADQVRAYRLWHLFNRLLAISIRHQDVTGWMYRPPEGGVPGKWVYTETDTEEN